MNHGLSLALAFSFFVLGQGCSEDEPGDGNNATTVDMGQDAEADVPEDAEPDQFVPPVYDEFVSEICRNQFGDQVTIYSEHSEPSGCLLITLQREEASSDQSITTNDGWSLLAATVLDDSGCPSEIPGDQTQQTPIDQVSGDILLEFAVDDYPIALTEASIEVTVSEGAGNPFGSAVLQIMEAEIPVTICPGGLIDE